MHLVHVNFNSHAECEAFDKAQNVLMKSSQFHDKNVHEIVFDAISGDILAEVKHGGLTVRQDFWGIITLETLKTFTNITELLK